MQHHFLSGFELSGAVIVVNTAYTESNLHSWADCLCNHLTGAWPDFTISGNALPAVSSLTTEQPFSVHADQLQPAKNMALQQKSYTER